MVNVAINGFGRIGRNTLRAAIKEGIFEKIKMFFNCSFLLYHIDMIIYLHTLR